MSQVTEQGARATTQNPMSDKINDIAWQAHQGSVAAIIQILNENLVTSGVRTRAVFADGVLQLLCEAATVEQLEESILVEKIQQILESIAPRNIRRVNINSRIVREEQLLWLEEINRDRENQLLWSQEIVLSKPGIFQQFIQDLQSLYNSKEKSISSQSLSLLNLKNQQQVATKRLIIGSTILFTIIAIYALNNNQFITIINNLLPIRISTSVDTENRVKSPNTSVSGNQNQVNSSDNDYFAEAVRFANQATVNGKTAITRTQWLEIAATWQRASDLMSKVPATHPRHQEAQIRMKLYKEYSKTAEEEAEKRNK
ncbi:MAG: hypothetical protein EAZ76_15780 [Nostocales cyanobacterium]|nr:MAG: hypothetical protein EAZ87_13990 [Nostocales cyanobacterium]TAF10208.1 MAG: hypothetical protein EAZ76_15780 [Nostocales cyanobacterium]